MSPNPDVPPRRDAAARLWLRAWLIAALLALALTPSSARAQSPPQRQPEEPQEAAPRARFDLAAEVGLGRLDEDLFVSASLQLVALLQAPGLVCHLGRPSCHVPLRAALQVPLRLRVVDRPPAQGGLVREADWDELSDTLRLIRQITYGGPGDALQLKLGELGPVGLGHGSLVSGYYNVVNPDHWSLGVAGKLRVLGGSGELFVDDVLEPALLGGGVMLYPARWFDSSRWSLLDRLGVGGQLVTDLRAPTDLRPDPQGVVAVEDGRTPVVEDARATTLAGLSLSAWLVAADPISLQLYEDLNFHPGVGHGFHTGLELSVRWTERLATLYRAEVVPVRGGYLPRYVGPLYNIERYQLDGLGLGLPAPKLRAVAAVEPARDVYINQDLTLVLRGLDSAVSVRHVHARARPEADALTVALDVGPIGPVAARLFYHHNLFDGLGQALSLERGVLVNELRVTPLDWLYVVGRYNRRWRLRDDGVYTPIQDWGVGVGAQVALQALARP